MTEIFVEYRQDPENDWWTATVPQVPAVVSQGRTLEEVWRRVRNAIRLVRGAEFQFQLTGATFWDQRHDLNAESVAAAKKVADSQIAKFDVVDEPTQSRPGLFR